MEILQLVGYIKPGTRSFDEPGLPLVRRGSVCGQK